VLLENDEAKWFWMESMWTKNSTAQVDTTIQNQILVTVIIK
jgi:hypothetical protein